MRSLDVSPDVLRRLVALDPERFPVLFDSAAQGALGARTVLPAYPEGALWLSSDGTLGASGTALRVPAIAARDSKMGFLAALDAWWRFERIDAQAPDGFHGGWVVYLGYEVACEVEPTLHLPRERLPWRAFALRTPAALVHDIASGTVVAVAETGRESLLTDLGDAIASLGPVDSPNARSGSRLILAEEAPDAFLQRVLRAQDAIRAGDIYQANLSRWWRAKVAADFDSVALYERLRAANPAPFAAFARYRGFELLSSSPERLISIEGRRVSTRPIAGTRPRSRRPGEDVRETHAMVTHPKERAEHVMLIDLERNDLGRICEAGSVVVDEFMAVESYAHVHHIVSNVSGTLRKDVTPVDTLRAVFPGGTITGCPKVRCMEIIAELEQEGRGAYTGSIGYLTREGNADFNILIRTLTVANGELELRAGAGIVADSDPARELDETRAKARGLLRAFDVLENA